MRPGPPSSRKLPYEDDASAAVRAIRNHLALEEIEAAFGVYQKAREKMAGWAPPTPEWVELIKGLINQEAWDSAIAVMLSYGAEAEAPSPRVLLKLAQLLLQKQERPARAIRVLEEIPEQSLPEALRPIRRQLVEEASRMRDEGSIELGDEV